MMMKNLSSLYFAEALKNLACYPIKNEFQNKNTYILLHYNVYLLFNFNRLTRSVHLIETKSNKVITKKNFNHYS